MRVFARKEIASTQREGLYASVQKDLSSAQTDENASIQEKISATTISKEVRQIVIVIFLLNRWVERLIKH